MHRMYAKVVPRRKIIRECVQDIFLQIIHENRVMNGVDQILNNYSSWASGFAVPLRPENAEFFHKIIIPLHKV